MAVPAQAESSSPGGPVNGGFEQPVDDGQIPGWTHTLGVGDGGFAVVDAPVFDGGASLEVHDPEDGVAYGLLSEEMPVQAGHTYELRFQALVEEPREPGDLRGKAYLYFYDANGTRVHAQSTHLRDIPAGEWTGVRLAVTAPEGAVSAAALLYTQRDEISTYYADDVELVHTLEPLEITDLGVAMRTNNVRASETDVLPDGTPVAYLFNNGAPTSLNVVDLRTGEVLDTHHFDQHTVASSAVVAEDHTLYFSGRSPSLASLWRYDPITQDLEQLLDGPTGETAISDLISDGSTIYASTYPSAKVLAYDVGTGELRDYGSITDKGDYARYMTMVDGDLWVGTSTSPQLIVLDPETGARSELPIPPDMEVAGDFFSELTTHGDLVLARYSPSGEANSAIYDLTAGEWCCVLDAAAGRWTLESVDGAFFYASGGVVKAFDIETRQSRSIGWEDSALAGEYDGTSRMTVVEMGTEELPGATLVGTRADGTVWRYNLETRTGDVISTDIVGNPARVHSVGVGPDGDVYFGAYLSSGVMARVDHEAGVVERLSGPSQAGSIVAHGNKIVVGMYPNAEFYAGHVNKDWDWGTNPEHLLTIGRAAGQDRPGTMVSAGHRVAVGTIPNYGELGGALVLLNPHSGEYVMHRNVVPDQSVTSLAYRDGLVYGGTSIHGAINSTPTQDTAELFVWDARADRFVTRSVVVEGATIIHSLAFDDEGRLWGMADEGTLFEYDPQTHEVVRRIDTGIRNGNIWGRTSELFPHPDNGLMYGNAGGQLFRFDPDDPDVTVLASGGIRYSAVHGSGTVYYGDNTNIFRLEQ
ncbi:hypothetical protein [Georgenia subflava]|uniref:PQQ-binding-like beta-propeller repeat protein n=1 Tax=Georgenia subflava TaxID=1622177 RepID=A0A6N7EDG0_9MICO|nr:hypothetical protein [Georgenia subflava]MPV36462.1 hypothetical protein [Georgenia subflava]